MSDELAGMTQLPLPSEALEALSSPRVERIHHHEIKVNLDWWNEALKARPLPAGRVWGRNSAGDITTDGLAVLTRGDLFDLSAHDRDGFPLLWHALAWGSGRRVRKNLQRMDAVAEDLSAAAAALTHAAELSASNPLRAYERLRRGRRNTIKHLGPSFFTKFLYFAGGGASAHPSLILDSRVADTLARKCGWSSLNVDGPWPAPTYGVYCCLLAIWATQASDHLGKQVCADELERWLFDVGKPQSLRRRRQA